MGRAGGASDRRSATSVLNVAGVRLIDSYRGLICDLDGVVYRGKAPIPGAIETLTQLSQDGIGVVFATNNASRTPGEVRGHLRELGLDPETSIVVTSAQAAAAYVASIFPSGTSVLAVGGPGVAAALREAGLRPLAPGDSGEQVDVIVQGAGADVSWSDLAEAAFAIQAGAQWVATNRDLTIPMQRGLAPGNGTLVNAVRRATSQDPVVVGKPEPQLYQLAVDQLGIAADEVLVVGDRLDTDIAGARAGGMASLLVLTGAHQEADIAAASQEQLPDYVSTDLRGLLGSPGAVRRIDHGTGLTRAVF